MLRKVKFSVNCLSLRASEFHRVTKIFQRLCGLVELLFCEDTYSEIAKLAESLFIADRLRNYCRFGSSGTVTLGLVLCQNSGGHDSEISSQKAQKNCLFANKISQLGRFQDNSSESGEILVNSCIRFSSRFIFSPRLNLRDDFFAIFSQYARVHLVNSPAVSQKRQVKLVSRSHWDGKLSSL